MAKTAAAGKIVAISKGTWEWARSKPEYSRLIEDLEDLEAIRKTKEESKETVPFEAVIAKYEKTHKVNFGR
jgi:Zn-dependent M32 family carboxypeptidase